MAKPNYEFEKRKRDLAKKAAKEAKRQRKLTKPSTSAEIITTDVVPTSVDALLP